MPATTGTLISLCGALALAAGSAACSSGTQSAGSGSSSQPASQSVSAPASGPSGPATTAAPSSCPSGPWQTGPISVSHQVAVPPVPVATAITTGSHPDCKYDRLVIAFNGPLPGYQASFESSVIQDGSGKTISLPGSRYLVLRFKPAQGHSANGTALLSRQPQAPGYPMLSGYVVSGDFEGVLSVALGLAGGTKYRIGELSGRIYVDVSW